MADQTPSPLDPPSPEQRQIAAGNFGRANQVLATGNFDYGIRLLLESCRRDPGNLTYRQALRRAQKALYKNNLRGSRLAPITNSPVKAKLKAAKHSRDYLKVLELGEEVLGRNPWDLGAQLDMAEAADALGLTDMAVWILDQARQKDGKDPGLNRVLAKLFEKRGDFARAIFLWDQVRAVLPNDAEAQQKAKDLAASETIARGHYGAGEAGEGGGGPAPAAPGRPAGDAEGDRAARELAALTAGVAENPTDPTAYLRLAAYHRRAGDLDQAREVLAQAAGATGQHFQITLELVELDLEPFRRNLALAEAKLRDADPSKVEELRKLRVRLLKEINTRELDLYRLKADRFPNDLGHRLELGLRLLRAGQVDEAIQELQQARKDPRSQWRALMYLGHCFKGRNHWKLAQRNFEDALQALPATEENGRKEILFQLAQGCAEANDLAKAVELAHELANLDYGYKDIGRLLGDWEKKLQQA